MKLKYSLSAWLLPKLKQNNSHNPTVINRRNKEQKYFAIALLLLWLLIYLLVPGKAHGQTANGLTIGQQVPDITITGILNAPYNSAKISDYKGKILVLDFWATWCVSCINNLGKTYALQRQFPDQLRVLLVNCKSTRDNAEKVMAFFNSRKAYYSFPSVVGDTVLGQLFPHQTVPHYVWIKDNKVVAITDAFEMSASNVEAMISGSDAHIHQEVVLNYDFNKPLFEDQNGGTPSGYIYKSFLTGYKDGLRHSCGFSTDYSGSVSRIYALNYSKMGFLKMAFPKLGQICSDRIILNSKKPGLMLADSNSFTWKTKYCYVYQSIFPPRSRAGALANMQADVENYFQLKVDEIALDTPCFVITISDSTKIIKAAAQSEPQDNEFEGTGAPVYFVNNLHHTEPLIWSKVSHQSAQSEPPKKGGKLRDSGQTEPL